AVRDGDLRSGRAADGGRPRPGELRRHRRRSCQRTEARRRSAHVQRRPADRGGDHGGRDRRLGRGDRGALGEGPHEKTDRRLHRRHHRAARKTHGPRWRPRLRRHGHRAGKARRHGGVLLAGYAYADLTHRLGARRQALLHVGLLALSLAFLPVLASSGWKPQGDEQPIARILLLLLATIGLPYFLLSTTTPLLQAWYW